MSQKHFLENNVLTPNYQFSNKGLLPTSTAVFSPLYFESLAFGRKYSLHLESKCPSAMGTENVLAILYFVKILAAEGIVYFY